MRLAHISDVHFGDENTDAVAACADYLAQQPVDLTVVSGDLTRWGERREFEAGARWLESLPGPGLATPGNHDAPYIAWAERIVAPFARYRRHVGPTRDESYLGRDFAVRAINTARGAQPRLNWSKGQVSLLEAAEAADWLDQAGAGRLRVAVCHHPLVEMIGGPMTARVWNGRAAAALLSDAGVDLVLSGHIHVPFALPLPCADERSYAVGAGTLSLRERGTPAGFNIIEADETEIRVMALAWTGSHFEPSRTWSLDRRRRR
jgi:3',5'-cyclic AMP phosphodiesterase CpdA